MNIIRDGILLIVYSFIIILAFIFTSDPFAQTVAGIAGAGSDISMVNTIHEEVIMVYGMCCAIAVLIPTIVFIYLSFNTKNQEYYW